MLFRLQNVTPFFVRECKATKLPRGCGPCPPACGARMEKLLMWLDALTRGHLETQNLRVGCSQVLGPASDGCTRRTACEGCSELSSGVEGELVLGLLHISLFIFICGIRRVGEKRRGLVTTASSSFLVTYICGQFSTLYSIKGKRGTVLATG